MTKLQAAGCRRSHAHARKTPIKMTVIWTTGFPLLKLLKFLIEFDGRVFAYGARTAQCAGKVENAIFIGNGQQSSRNCRDQLLLSAFPMFRCFGDWAGQWFGNIDLMPRRIATYTPTGAIDWAVLRRSIIHWRATRHRFRNVNTKFMQRICDGWRMDWAACAFCVKRRRA